MPTEAISVGGPYWGLNLVLWPRMIKHPAIGLGNNFSTISRRHIQTGLARLAPGTVKEVSGNESRN